MSKTLNSVVLGGFNISPREFYFIMRPSFARGSLSKKNLFLDKFTYTGCYDISLFLSKPRCLQRILTFVKLIMSVSVLFNSFYFKHYLYSGKITNSVNALVFIESRKYELLFSTRKRGF
jgi:hypothetical protein